MASPLQGSLAAKIGKAFASTFYDATLLRTTRETPDGSPSWDRSDETTTTFACKGMVDTYSDYAVANSVVDGQDRKVLILATSLSTTPTDRDRVSIRGKTYRIVDVSTDPAQAVWELQCRI